MLNHKLTSLVISLLLMAWLPRAGGAEDFADFAELDLEELLNVEVVSASKYSQKISESPNAMYVITREDIERSGAVDLPDLFRMAPGVDVINVYGGVHGVSARGMNERFGGRMLVMIDGRSIYTNFFGGVFWENEEVFLEDIKQIEVIRGPGAAMWGANSINGVINIITRDPSADSAALISLRAGTRHYREGVFRYSGSPTERLSFSLSGGYSEDQGARGTHDFTRIPKVNARLKYRISQNSTLHLFAGVNEAEGGVEFTRYTSVTDVHIRSNYQMLRWEHTFSSTSHLNFQMYHSRLVAHGEDHELDIEEEKFDMSLEHAFMLGERNRIVWGGNYRSVEVNSDYLRPETDHDDLLGFFVQDEIHLRESLSLVAGVKYENNSFTGREFSPRGCLLFSPAPNHHLRLSVSRAYRTPSFAENSVWLTQPLPRPLPPLSLVAAEGNRRLHTEKMTAFELGYRTTLFNRVGLNVELYYNEIDNVVRDSMSRYKLPFRITWDNTYNTIAKGTEIAVDIPVTPWWQLTANYTFQSVEEKRIDHDYKGSPRHKINIGSRFTFSGGWEFDVRAHFVDETKWSGLGMRDETDDYLRVDARIAKKMLGDRLVLALVGQNLTDRLHPETIDVIGRYEAERLIYGQITLRLGDW